jgi:ADP-heptose:LPS heptosyltransferase
MTPRDAVVSPMRHPPRAKATSPPSLEWKKQADRLLGAPLVLAVRLLRALRRAGRPAAAATGVDDARHVVLCKLWGLGNLAMVLPLVEAVRARHPRARITFVTLERNRELLASQPGLDRILTIKDHGLAAPLSDLLRVIRALRADRPDLFLDFEQFLRVSGLVARASGARFVVGFDTPGQDRRGLHDRTAPCAPDRHMSRSFAALAKAAGLPTDGVPSHALVVPAAARPRVAALVGEGAPRPWFVLHPGSGDNFPGRRWPVERFAAAAARLHSRHGGTLFVTGGAGERPLAAELVAELAAQRIVARDFCGALDLPELLALLGASDLLISNDTGPVHLATALRKPVVALFGPNSPQLYGPLGASQRALYHAPPCSPCLTNQNAKSSGCTLPICILRISVDEVAAAAEELLAPRPAERVVLS